MNNRIKELLAVNAMHCSMNSFLSLIRAMNNMYELPVNNTPAEDMNMAEQLQSFKKIMMDELADIVTT